MNRDKLLTKLAMELAEWPMDSRHARRAMPGVVWFEIEATTLAAPDDGREGITERHWLAERARLINKPSWDDAPERAEWLAQDADGTWYWYEDKPESPNAMWAGPAVHRQSPIQGALPAGHDWRATLEKRPASGDHAEPEWVEGDWPPPINKACEYRDAPNSEWCQGVCVGYYNGYAVVVDEGIGGVSVQIVEQVRPLLTPEQKAVDKIHAVIMALPDDTDTRVAAQDIYNAIRGGDVPGVGLMGGEA